MLVSRFMFMVGNSFSHHRAGREGLGELMRIGLLERDVGLALDGGGGAAGEEP